MKNQYFLTGKGENLFGKPHEICPWEIVQHGINVRTVLAGLVQQDNIAYIGTCEQENTPFVVLL